MTMQKERERSDSSKFTTIDGRDTDETKRQSNKKEARLQRRDKAIGICLHSSLEAAREDNFYYPP